MIDDLDVKPTCVNCGGISGYVSGSTPREFCSSACREEWMELNDVKADVLSAREHTLRQSLIAQAKEGSRNAIRILKVKYGLCELVLGGVRII